MSEVDDTYTPAQAAKILLLSEPQIIQLITDGDLAGAMDEGGRWRIPRRAVHDRLGTRLAVKSPRTHNDAPLSREADFYSPGEAANLLGLPEFTILGLLTSGELEGQQDEQARWWIPAAVVVEASKHADEAQDSRESLSPASEETTQLDFLSDPAPRTLQTDTDGQSANESGWTTTDVAARALAVSPRTVRRLIDRGELEGRKVREGIVEAWEVAIDSLYALRDKREAEGQVRRIDPRTSVERREPPDIPPDTSDYIRELTERLLRLSTEVGELRTRLELTAKTESTLQEERDRLQVELERVREELEAERSKGFWRRLFGG
jgi:excisionase family DNA binding protein